MTATSSKNPEAECNGIRKYKSEYCLAGKKVPIERLVPFFGLKSAQMCSIKINDGMLALDYDEICKLFYGKYT